MWWHCYGDTVHKYCRDTQLFIWTFVWVCAYGNACSTLCHMEDSGHGLVHKFQNGILEWHRQIHLSESLSALASYLQ